MASVVSPASKLRANVLEVLKREGYIRGFTPAEWRRGIAELKIELKYHEGQPVIREIIAGVEAGPARLFEDRRPAARL